MRLARGAVLAQARTQLSEYLAGDRLAFDHPLRPRGTPFQERVWAALAAFPFGETRSYRDIAAQVGRPDAVRAVGAANGRNPLPIAVPCHRVIGADGALAGYGGGIARKTWLIRHERAVLARRGDRGRTFRLVPG
jgi:methylated-DNA-[protein]-cysteine S-methyltransferase